MNRTTALLSLFLFVGLTPLRAQQAAAAASAAPVALTAADVEKIAGTAFRNMAPKGLAIAVVQDGALLCEFAFGERSDGVPVTPRSLFNIASCSKAFTAALIAELVHEGKLRWDDRVVDHLPQFRMQDPWITAHMTIADLLSHRCGLVTFAGDLLWYNSNYTDEQVLARIEKLPIPQRFRDQFGYQNLMYMVAGMVAERVVGKPWVEQVETRFLQPLGMADSRSSPERLPEGAERAVPHIDGKPVQEHVYVACKPAASMWSSVHDMTNWITMLLQDGKWQGRQIVEPESLCDMWKPHTAMSPSGLGAGTGDLRSYGLGWFINLERGKKLIEHDGGMPGFLSKVSLMPEEKFGFVVLNNGNDGVVNELIKSALLRARRGEDAAAYLAKSVTTRERLHAHQQAGVHKREAARIADTKTRLPVAEYAGRYTDEAYGDAEITLRDGALHVALLPAGDRIAGTMRHWHHDTFRVDFPDTFLPFALVQFTFDSAGKVEAFGIDCPIADFDFGALRFVRNSGK